MWRVFGTVSLIAAHTVTQQLHDRKYYFTVLVVQKIIFIRQVDLEDIFAISI